MPEEREGPEREGEEDFEPLDRFFAPIEDVDFPEEGEPPGGTRLPADSGQVEGGPIDEDLLPSDIPDDPLADLEIDEVVPTPGEPTAEIPGGEFEELRLDVGEAGAARGPGDAVDQASWSDEPGVGEPAEETWQDEVTSALTEGAPGLAEAGEGPLSLDDLKNAPPEYADLPGPPGDDEGVIGGPVLEEEAGTEAEPELEQVEAAADRFAESLRGDEEEPLLMPSASGGDLPPPDEVEEDLLSDLGREPAPPPTVTVGVTGPSWQEPTSEEVSAGPSPPPFGGRNLPLAFISGIILVAIGIGAIALGKVAFTVVAGATIVLAQGELYAALHRKGYQPATALGLVFGGLISAAAYLRGEGGALAMFVLGSIFTFLWFMATPAKARTNALADVAMTILPLGYIALLGSYVMTIIALPGGRTLVLCVIGLAVGYDIAAFAIGSLWGQRPLAPSISPRKSWEAAIGAPLVLLVVAVAFLATLDPFKAAGGSAVFRAIGLALVVSLFAQLGDLAESMLKRDMGIKDMGSIVPGHGGALDRIDSIIFAAPAAFYLIRLFFS